MTQLNLLDLPTEPPHFDGATYDHERDGSRLTSQLERVRALMSDGEWRDLETIRIRCGGTTASVSARLRDIRKPKFYGATIERRYVSYGFWEYRMVPKEQA